MTPKKYRPKVETVTEAGSHGDLYLALGCLAYYAKTSFNPFVSRLHFCTSFIVLRRLWRLAVAWPPLALTPIGTFIHDPHLTWVEGWRRFDVSQPRRWLLLGCMVVSLPPVLNAINIIRDWTIDSTSHNLFPFEFAMLAFVSLPALPGAFLGSRIGRVI